MCAKKISSQKQKSIKFFCGTLYVSNVHSCFIYVVGSKLDVLLIIFSDVSSVSVCFLQMEQHFWAAWTAFPICWRANIIHFRVERFSSMSIFCAMYESWFCEERHLKVEIKLFT